MADWVASELSKETGGSGGDSDREEAEGRGILCNVRVRGVDGGEL